VDGHDVIRLVKLLEDMKKLNGPKLLHIVTVKGKGYERAEKEQTIYHAPGVFDKATGDIQEDKCHNQPPKYQTVFGRTIVELAEKNPKIVGITPAMLTGCSLNIMMTKMPERTFDVGIAEQHAVTFSAGLAASGMVPFCNVYSTFLQRAYDQIIHDVALQKLNVVFCLDRGGLVGEDGATHHGSFDLAYLNCIPNMTVSAPMNEEELRNLMYTAQLEGKGPFAIRYPRGRGVMPVWKTPFAELPVGKGKIIREGTNAAVISIGHVGNDALSACKELEQKGFSVALYNMIFLKPIDTELLHTIFRKFKKIITVEDGSRIGGLGSSVIDFMSENGYSAKIKKLGIPDYYVEQGTIAELHHECGFDKEGIVKALTDLLTD
jgi:1-deoxy-D-xylulose-5-phosphate synthase